MSFRARRYCDLPGPLGRARRGARIVSGIDSKRAIFGLRPLTDVVDGAFGQPRLDAAILSSFASAALALAGIGLYSLFMLVVADRTREIAVRLAIGASPAEMIRLVAAAAARLLAGGLVLGVGLTAAADRVLRGVLFGVASFDAGAGRVGRGHRHRCDRCCRHAGDPCSARGATGRFARRLKPGVRSCISTFSPSVMLKYKI